MKKFVTFMPHNHYTDNTGKKIYEDCVILDAAGREIGSLAIGELYTDKNNTPYKELRAGNRVIGKIIIGCEND